MKRLLLNIMILLPVLSFAQSEPSGYFHIDKGHVIWQNTYPFGMSPEEAARRLTIEGLRVVDVTDGMVAFFCDGLRVFPEEYGYSRGETPMYVTGCDLVFRGFLQIKEGRYRVTLDRIQLVDNTTTGGGVFVAGTAKPIEQQAVSKDDFSSGFKKIPSMIYNRMLYNIFTLLPPEAADHLGSEW